jgi:hypothetical protein
MPIALTMIAVLTLLFLKFSATVLKENNDFLIVLMLFNPLFYVAHVIFLIKNPENLPNFLNNKYKETPELIKCILVILAAALPILFVVGYTEYCLLCSLESKVQDSNALREYNKLLMLRKVGIMYNGVVDWKQRYSIVEFLLINSVDPQTTELIRSLFLVATVFAIKLMPFENKLFDMKYYAPMFVSLLNLLKFTSKHFKYEHNRPVQETFIRLILSEESSYGYSSSIYNSMVINILTCTIIFLSFALVIALPFLLKKRTLQYCLQYLVLLLILIVLIKILNVILIHEFMNAHRYLLMDISQETIALSSLKDKDAPVQ